MSAARRLRDRFAALLCLAGLAPALAEPAGATGRWRVALDGLDVTRAAEPRQLGEVILVNLTALAGRLGCTVRVSGVEFIVRDAAGSEWRGEAGSAVLEGPARRLPLAVPGRLEGRALYLPLAAVAELAGLALTLDPKRAQASLARFSGTAAGADLLAQGWQSFRLEKPPEERPVAPLIRPDVAPVPPPDRGTLRMDAAVGHVGGLDWGAELSAAGTVGGLLTRFNSVLTSGTENLEFRSGYLLLSDQGQARFFEAGDLSSELLGFGRGARYSWSAGVRHSPAIALLLDGPAVAGGEPALVVRDELQLGERTLVSGEAASDGAWLLGTRYGGERLRLFGHLRSARGARGGDAFGLAGDLELWRGVVLQASFGRSGSDGARLDSRQLLLRLPLVRHLSLTLDGTDTETVFSRVRGGRASLALEAGPLLATAHYLRRETQLPIRSGGRALRFRQDEVLAAASWLMRAGLRFEAQSRWSVSESAADRWVHLGVNWSMLPGTSLQVLGTFSSLPGASHGRIWLSRELARGFSLVAEYGNVPGFQVDRAGAGSDARANRFKLTLHRTWDVETPAGGSAVTGRIGGASSTAALGGIPVRLGPYRALSDAQGRYSFRHVPAGSYELKLEEGALPADHAAEEPPRTVRLAGDRLERIDLGLVPLGAAQGWVYLDRDADGRCGPGEGVSGVAVVLGDRSTVSAADGSFGFFNLNPGSYAAHLDVRHLTALGLTAETAQIQFGFPPGETVDGLEFRLLERQKEIRFQALPSR